MGTDALMNPSRLNRTRVTPSGKVPDQGVWPSEEPSMSDTAAPAGTVVIVVGGTGVGGGNSATGAGGGMGSTSATAAAVG